MSGFLERLGRWCARHPWRTIGAWILVAIVVGVLAASAKGYSESFTIPGTESQQATDLLKDRFPAQAGATAQVVLHAKTGALTDPANAAAIDASLAKVEQLPGVTAVVSPTEAGANGLSKQRRHRVRGRELREARQRDQGRRPRPSSKPRCSRRATRACRSSSVARSRAPVSARTSASTEIYGLIAAMIVLLIAFGSVVAMGVPIGTALVGLAVGLSTVTVLTNFFDISQIATTIATMIGLGRRHRLRAVRRHPTSRAARRRA